jgi:glycosyltransferase involved in cell wall biosynthesis
MQISVVIPAYNEAGTIGATLDSLVRAPDSEPDIEIIVAANGCRDATADIARSYGVEVLDLAEASKTVALNAADESSSTFPRVYLDADARATPTLIRALGEAVSEPGAAGATAQRVLDLEGCEWPVRAFYRISAELPAFENRLFGRGVIAVSEEARKRFERFPDIIADDMLLDAVVAADEKREVALPVRVEAPRRTADLVRRVARAREGNDEFARWMRAEGEALGLAQDVASPKRTSWLRDVVARKPRLAGDAAVYVGIIARAERLRRSKAYSARSGWGTRSS